MTPRFHYAGTLSAGAAIALPDAAAHHASRVLRLQPGDDVTLFTGDGGEYAGRLLRDEGQDRRAHAAVRVHVDAFRPIERESPLNVTLVQGLPAADKMDYIVQKAVELGVAAVQPVTTARSVARLDDARAAKRVAHWREIVISACEQCGRNRVPVIHPPREFAAWIRASSTAATRLLCTPESAPGLGQFSGLSDLADLGEVRRPDRAIEILIGPEGGLTADEANAAQGHRFISVRMGPRVLRTETAAAAALAALNALYGDWR